MEWLGEAKEIDIIVAGNLVLTSIPIKGIADFEVGKNHIFHTIQERQACLEFGELSPDQTKIVEALIEIYKLQ